LIDGYNVAIDFRWADNKADRLPALAAALAHRQVAVIVGQNFSARAAKAATSTIPLVFVIGGDPIASGLVTSLNRPDGNVTGVSFSGVRLQAKRLELLHELVPPTATIAWLRDPGTAQTFQIEGRDVEAAARELGRSILSLNASTPSEIDAAFSTIVATHARAVLIDSSALFNTRRRQLAALTMRHSIPAIAHTREFVMAGGASSYYVPRILKGASPRELPVEMPTKYELVLNVVAAKALGLDIRPSCSRSPTR
jgi:putative ABC transport system substrate-binding protein